MFSKFSLVVAQGQKSGALMSFELTNNGLPAHFSIYSNCLLY